MLISKFDKDRDTIVNDLVYSKLAGKSVLELGCGSGDRTQLFFGFSYVTGIDIKNRVCLDKKRKFVFSLADATKLPFKDECFDAVVSFDVIEHILDDKRFLSESFRVCKKGGFVLVGTPNRMRLSNRLMNLFGKKIVYPYYLGPDTIHIREYTQMEFVSICQNAGFVGECICLWIGLVGRIDKGLTAFPNFLSSLTQYLIFVGKRP